MISFLFWEIFVCTAPYRLFCVVAHLYIYCEYPTVLRLYMCICLCLLYRLAFQSLQNIFADLPDWRSDVVSGMSISVSLSVCLCVYQYILASRCTSNLKNVSLKNFLTHKVFKKCTCCIIKNQCSFSVMTWPNVNQCVTLWYIVAHLTWCVLLHYLVSVCMSVCLTISLSSLCSSIQPI